MQLHNPLNGDQLIPAGVSVDTYAKRMHPSELIKEYAAKRGSAKIRIAVLSTPRTKDRETKPQGEAQDTVSELDVKGEISTGYLAGTSH